jgi:hypothetical protein
MKPAEDVTRMGKVKRIRRCVVKPKVKRPRGKPRRGWENNIKVDLK